MRKLFVFSIFLILVSCQESVTQVATVVDGVVTVNTSDVKTTVDMKLSDLVEDMEIIQLDSEAEAYVFQYAPVAFSENYLVCFSQTQAKLFDRKTGKFLTNIGAQGNGPGEYGDFVENYSISEKRGSIFIVNYSGARCIIEYDLQGKFKRQIPLADKRAISNVNFIIDDDKDVITIFCVPLNGVVWQQDFEGNALTDKAIMVYDRKNWNSSKSIVTNNTFNIFNNKNFNKQDTLCKYDRENHKINPIFTTKVDMYSESENITDTKVKVAYRETPKYFIASLMNTEYVAENGRVYGITYSFKEHIFINKENLSGNYVNLKNDYLFDDKISLLNLTDDLLYETYSAERLMEIIENASEEQRQNTDPEILKRLDELYENLDEESNTTIFVGKLK